MTTEDLKETAEIAHLNLDENELNKILPLFNEMLGFLDTMKAAGELNDVSNNRTVDSKFYLSVKQANTNSAALTEELLEKSGERDGRFIVVPNVL